MFFTQAKGSPILNSKCSAIYIFIVLCSFKVSFTAIKVHHLKKDKGNCSSKTTNGCPFCFLEPSYLKSSVGDPQEFAIADPCPYHVKYSPDVLRRKQKF